ncbi:MAG: thiolase family protein [Pseudomonadota bacterium]|nr:thiolase family protein [Pseudomonadota bacterium]QKK06487.1 MAG: thiolase family protein [Pseudomonadota bacterium]
MAEKKKVTKKSAASTPASKKSTPASTERTVVIAGYVRSPFTPAHKGELKDVRPDDLVAQTINGLLKKTGVDPNLIEDVKLGTAFPEAEQGLNVGRNINFLTDLPKETAGVTINRFCGSSMQAIHDAAGMIALGSADAVIAAGVESMSRVPMGGFNPAPNPDIYENRPGVYMGMGETAEIVADKYHVGREEQEDLAVSSHEKANKADIAGLFRDEIVEITKKDGSKVDHDGCIRPGTSKEGLSKLKTAFKKEADGGTVTAGTSSPLTDGASAVLVTTEEFAKKHGLPILAKIKSTAVSGCDPETMGMGPVEATKKALKRANLDISDIDVVEINEAFAAQGLACLKELGIDLDKVNKDGGAIAMGHPLGASGARITGKAAQILKRDGGRYALATMCIGGGQGIATILEHPSNDNKKPKPAPAKTMEKPAEKPVARKRSWNPFKRG